MAHRLSPEAEAELDEIWWYIAQESGSADTARTAVASITQRFYLLADYPRLGRPRDELRPGLRSHAVGNYLILYRIEQTHVLIVHVLHGRRDIETLLHQE
jgi:toxin ParE1/3/4